MPNTNTNNNKNNVNNSKQVVNVIIEHYKRKPRKKKVNNNQQILKPNVLPINVVNNIPGMAPSFQDLHRYHTNVANDDLIYDLQGQIGDMNESINMLRATGDMNNAELIEQMVQAYDNIIEQLKQQRNISQPVNIPPNQTRMGYPRGLSLQESEVHPLFGINPISRSDNITQTVGPELKDNVAQTRVTESIDGVTQVDPIERADARIQTTRRELNDSEAQGIYKIDHVPRKELNDSETQYIYKIEPVARSDAPTSPIREVVTEQEPEPAPTQEQQPEPEPLTPEQPRIKENARKDYTGRSKLTRSVMKKFLKLPPENMELLSPATMDTVSKIYGEREEEISVKELKRTKEDIVKALSFSPLPDNYVLPDTPQITSETIISGKIDQKDGSVLTPSSPIKPYKRDEPSPPRRNIPTRRGNDGASASSAPPPEEPRTPAPEQSTSTNMTADEYFAAMEKNQLNGFMSKFATSTNVMKDWESKDRNRLLNFLSLMSNKILTGLDGFQQKKEFKEAYSRNSHWLTKCKLIQKYMTGNYTYKNIK